MPTLENYDQAIAEAKTQTAVLLAAIRKVLEAQACPEECEDLADAVYHLEKADFFLAQVNSDFDE